MTTDVAIIGGGVIGLSIAYRLKQEGIDATVLDRQEFGRESSWAGAGLIPAHTERRRDNPSVELRSWSAVLHREWAARLRDETGIDIGYRRNGGVDLALTSDEEIELRAMAGRWRREGIVFEKLAPGDFKRVEPALGPEIKAAYFLPDRAQIRNPWFLRALASALEARGARLLPNRAVLGLEVHGERVVAVRTETETIPCGAVVVAAGAWSAGLLGSLGVDAPTPPVKGQIVLLASPRDRPPLGRIVEHGSRYLVPRDDGRVLVGATEENVGFDKRPTASGVLELIHEAIRLCPILATAEVERAWAGLRPGSIDTRPYLGAIPGYVNAHVATGHKRSGLQLATGTAELITDLVLGRPPRVDLSPFRIGREPALTRDDPFRS